MSGRRSRSNRKSKRKSRKPRSSQKPIQNLRKGTLGKFGYSLEKTTSQRAKSLSRAVKKYGSGVVIKKLNAVCVLTKNKSPGNSKKFCSDKRWVQNTYGSQKSSKKRKSSKKSRRRRS